MMKFLIDNALSYTVAQGLREANFDAVHVREIDLETASDILIFKRAIKDNRIIVSADTDFGTLLAQWQGSKPSVILFRGGYEHLPKKQVALLLANLPNVQQSLEDGSIVVIGRNRVRIRTLPIGFVSHCEHD
jgi:predicted nuclease of predicted toxin-antitoxin system